MRLLILFFLLLTNLSFAKNDHLVSILSDFDSIANGPQVACEEPKVKSHKTQNLVSPANQSYEISILSKRELDVLFKWLSVQRQIPFKYPEEGCYARAMEMARLMDEKKIISGKAIIKGDLRIETSNSPKGYVEWNYHIAPFVLVKEDGKIEKYVIDPSIFDHPVKAKEWFDIQVSHNPNQDADEFFTPRFDVDYTDKMKVLTDYHPGQMVKVKDQLAMLRQLQSQRYGF